MISKKLNIFIRFGGANMKKQKGFRKSNTYHSPPASNGIYCMPLVAQEFFLLGSMDIYQPGTMPKEPREKKNYEDTEEIWNEFAKKKKKALSVKRKQFIKKTGTIWHHLAEYTERNEIIAEHNSWVKTSIQAWQKAFSKMSLKHRYGCKSISTNSINHPARSGVTGMYSKDHCEVFFDEKV